MASVAIMACGVNASARNSTSGSVALISPSSRSQNRSGLVCGLSTGYSILVSHPAPCVASRRGHLRGVPCRIQVEVQRVTVLVLLRGVLRVGDGAVGQRGEPLRVLLDPTDGRARPGALGPGPPPCQARGRGPRTCRSPPSSPGRGAGRRARRPEKPIAHGDPGGSPDWGDERVVPALAERPDPIGCTGGRYTTSKPIAAIRAPAALAAERRVPPIGSRRCRAGPGQPLLTWERTHTLRPGRALVPCPPATRQRPGPG